MILMVLLFFLHLISIIFVEIVSNFFFFPHSIYDDKPIGQCSHAPREVGN